MSCTVEQQKWTARLVVGGCLLVFALLAMGKQGGEPPLAPNFPKYLPPIVAKSPAPAKSPDTPAALHVDPTTTPAPVAMASSEPVPSPSSVPVPSPSPAAPATCEKWVKMGPLIGGLGNNLYIFASSLGIARARNACLCTDHDIQGSRLLKAFNVSMEVPMCPPDVSSNCLNLEENGEYAKFHPSFFEGGNRCVLPRTYLQSYKFFDGVAIPWRLRYEDVAKAELQRLGVTACIHIRRTDMLAHPDLAPYNEVQYLQRAMDLMRKLKGQDTKFLVLSDDMGWVNGQSFLNDVARPSFNAYELEIAVLATCPNLIMTIGTFGWWGGYLNNIVDGGRGDKVTNRTVLYKPQVMRVQHQNDEDFFPKPWTPVRDD